MATRFYLPASGTPPVTPSSWSSAWTAAVIGAQPTRPLVTTKSNTALATTAAAEAVTTNPCVLPVARFVSTTLDVDQTITGTFTAVVPGLESNAGANASLQVVIRVVSQDGGTTRGTLYAGHTAANNTTVGALGEEFTTSKTTRIIPSTALTSVSAISGDRIVVEIGSRNSNTSGTSYTTTLTFGDPTATADFALTSGLTTTLDPWLELSQTLTFGTPSNATVGAVRATATVAAIAPVVSDGRSYIPPNIISYGIIGGSWANQTNPTATSAIVAQAGDKILVIASRADSTGGSGLAITTGSGLTWSTLGADTSANHCAVSVFTADVATSGTYNVAVDCNSTAVPFAARYWVFRGSDGIGTPVFKVTSPASMALSTTQDKSDIISLMADWTALNVTTTWTSIDAASAVKYDNDAFVSGQYTVDSVSFTGTSPAGTKTVANDTSSTTPTLVAVEVKGTLGAPPTSVSVAAIAPAVSAIRNISIAALAATLVVSAIPPVSSTLSANIAPPAATITIGSVVPDITAESILSGGGPASITIAAPAPSVTANTGAGSGSALHRVVIAAPRNGTAVHTIDPSSSTGVVSGTPFVPTAGNLLVVIVEGSVTSTTPTGWSLPTGGSAVNNTGLYVWYRDAAGADTFSTTHNGSDYPAAFEVIEFGAGSTFVSSVSDINVSATGNTGPNLTGLTGVNYLIAAAGQGSTSGSSSNSFTWSSGTETADTYVPRTGTDGYNYSSAVLDQSSLTSWAPGAVSTTGTPTMERLVFAVNAVATNGATVAATVATVSVGAVAPVITGAVHASVTAVAATSTVAAPAPAVATGFGATVVAVPATVAVGAAVPTLALHRVIDAVAATAAVAAPVPGVSTTSTVTVTAVPATATTAAVAPSVSTAVVTNVSAVSAAASVAALAPSVTAIRVVNVTAVVATASTAAVAPTVTTVRNVSIAAVAATASAVARPPVVSTTVSVNIAAVAATVQARSFAPVVVAVSSGLTILGSWNGTAVIDVEVLGIWNGATVEAVQTLGIWDRHNIV